MFYVKTQIDTNTSLVTEIAEDNVFTRCRDCGKEVSVVLSDVVDSIGELDLYGMGVCCPECSRARWKEVHVACERGVRCGHQQVQP